LVVGQKFLIVGQGPFFLGRVVIIESHLSALHDGQSAAVVLDRIVTDLDLFHVERVDLQQVAFDPVLKVGRELVGFDLGDVDGRLAGLANVTQAGLIRHGLADNQVEQILAGGVFHNDFHADAGRTELERFRIGIHHAVFPVIALVVALEFQGL